MEHQNVGVQNVLRGVQRVQREDMDAPLSAAFTPTNELLKSLDSLRGENRELRQALMREAEELAGENADLRAFLGAAWR